MLCEISGVSSSHILGQKICREIFKLIRYQEYDVSVTQDMCQLHRICQIRVSLRQVQIKYSVNGRTNVDLRV